MILLKFNCFSGGGPPFGCPRTITESPLRTCFTVARYNVDVPVPTEPEPPPALVNGEPEPETAEG